MCILIRSSEKEGYRLDSHLGALRIFSSFNETILKSYITKRNKKYVISDINSLFGGKKYHRKC